MHLAAWAHGCSIAKLAFADAPYPLLPCLQPHMSCAEIECFIGNVHQFKRPAALRHATPQRAPKHRCAPVRQAGTLTSQAFTKISGGPLWFGLPVSSILNSVVSLTVNADELTLVTNVAPGLVVSAVLCSFNNATCGSFTALNQHGYLHVVIQNTGYIASSYTAEVCNLPTSRAIALLLRGRFIMGCPALSDMVMLVCLCMLA